MRNNRWWCAVALLLAMSGVASGSESKKPPGIDPAVMTEGFLAAHPDLRWRGEGIRAYKDNDHALAMTYFQRAARYADKPSQAMLAEMYWSGIGVKQDRAIGYAWMDLAGERLYPDFIVMRERYWNALSEAERSNAIAQGETLYEEYGDAVAKPRLATILRRERRRTTGSRTGFVGNLTIIPNSGPLAGSGMTLSGEKYYAKEYWEPERYWQLQDEIWRAPAVGRVRVGEIETVAPVEDGGQSDGE